MTVRRRRGAAGITDRDVARIEALSGETNALMKATTGLVEAATDFRVACMEAGANATVAGTFAMRSAALPALISTAALLALPACRRRKVKQFMERFEVAQERLDESRGADNDALEDLADLLADIVAAGGKGGG